MKKHIRRLPKKVYDRIAAGEVIDRPSSILRELVDNSIDADSTDIIVNLSGGGNISIEVIDNGDGMSEDDIKICCEPFTTSKIDVFEDLLNLNTYGFRGEALNSISTISNVNIVSKREVDELATNLHIEGGEILSLSKTNRRKGTTIFIKNIFFNIPARKKSMKSQYSEYLNCKDIIINKYLPNSNISFELSNNGEKKLSLPSGVCFLEKLRILYDRNFIDSLLEINCEKVLDNNNKIFINGFISKPELNRPRRNDQYVFINKRPIYLSSISRAIMVGYDNILPQGRFPVVFLFIELPKEYLDVNIHPQKKEIRFINEKEIVSIIINTIRDNLTQNVFIEDAGKKINKNDNNPFEDKNINYNNTKKEFSNNKNDNDYNLSQQMKSKTNNQEEMYLTYSQTNDDNSNFNFHLNKDIDGMIKIDNQSVFIKGILFNRYIIIEKDEDFILIDKYEASRKIKNDLYKKNIKKYTNNQNLMFPILIEDSESVIKQIINNKNKIETFGFSFDNFGSNAIAIRVIPNFIDNNIDTEKLKDIFDKINDNQIDTIEKLIDYTIDIIDHHAGKNSTNLKELEYIIKELFKKTNPFISKSGKPIAIMLNISDIEYLFNKRR